MKVKNSDNRIHSKIKNNAFKKITLEEESKSFKYQHKNKLFINPLTKSESESNKILKSNISKNSVKLLKGNENSLPGSTEKIHKILSSPRNITESYDQLTTDMRIKYEATNIIMDSSLAGNINNFNKLVEFSNPVLVENRKFSETNFNFNVNFNLDFEKNNKKMKQNKTDALTNTLYSKQNILLYNKDDDNKNNKIITNTLSFCGSDGRRIPYKNEREIYVAKKGKSNVCYFRDILASANTSKTREYNNMIKNQIKEEKNQENNIFALPNIRSNTLSKQTNSNKVTVTHCTSDGNLPYNKSPAEKNKVLSENIVPTNQACTIDLEKYYENLQFITKKKSKVGISKNNVNKNTEKSNNESLINTADLIGKNYHHISKYSNKNSISNLNDEINEISYEIMYSDNISTDKFKNLKISSNKGTNSAAESVSSTNRTNKTNQQDLNKNQSQSPERLLKKCLSPINEEKKSRSNTSAFKRKIKFTETKKLNTFKILENSTPMGDNIKSEGIKKPVSCKSIGINHNYKIINSNSNFNLTNETNKSNEKDISLTKTKSYKSSNMVSSNFKFDIDGLTNNKTKEIINNEMLKKDLFVMDDNFNNLIKSQNTKAEYFDIKIEGGRGIDISEISGLDTLSHSNIRVPCFYKISQRIKNAVSNNKPLNLKSYENSGSIRKLTENVGTYEMKIINNVKIIEDFLNKQHQTNFESKINKYKMIYVVLDGSTIFKARRIPGKYLDIPSRRTLMSMPDKKERLEIFYNFLKNATKEFSNEKLFKSVFTMNGHRIFDLVDIPENHRAIFIWLNIYKNRNCSIKEKGFKTIVDDDIKLLNFCPVDRKKIVKRRFRLRKKRVIDYERKNLKPDNYNVRLFNNRQKRKFNNQLNNSFTNGYKFGKRLDYILEDIVMGKASSDSNHSEDFSIDLINNPNSDHKSLELSLELNVKKFDNFLERKKNEIDKFTDEENDFFEYEYISDCEDNINNRKLMLNKLYPDKNDLYEYFQAFSFKKRKIDIKNKYFNIVRLSNIKRPNENTKTGMINLINKYNFKRAKIFNINIKKTENEEKVMDDTNKLMMRYLEKLIFNFHETADLDEFALEDGEDISEKHFIRNKKFVENIHFQINSGVEKFYPDLISLNIPKILKSYPHLDKKNLYEIFVQFKCLMKICIALNKSMKILRQGMDFETFYHTVPGMNTKGVDLAKKIFEVINVRNNNHLSWDEFMKGMLNYKSENNDEKIKMFFNIIDINRNGLLSYKDVYDLSVASIKRKMGVTGKDEVANELADYLAKLVFKLMEIDESSKLPLRNLKDKILNKEPEFEYLEMFLCAD